MRNQHKKRKYNPTLNGTIYEHIDLSSLTEDQRIKTSESLKASIEAYQEEILNRLPVGWSHAGTYLKELVTTIGRVSLTVIRMKRPPSQGGGTTSPILDALSIRRKKYSRELRMSLASKASRMSYGDAQKDFQESSRLVVPKTTIHSFVQEVGSCLANVAATAASASQPARRNSGTSRWMLLVRRANYLAGSRGGGWNERKKSVRRRKYLLSPAGNSSSLL